MFATTLTFSYDGSGNRTKVEDSVGGVLTSVYNGGDLLSSRQFGGSGQTPLRVDLGYTPRLQVSSTTRYSDVAGTTVVGTRVYSYDSAGRTTNLQHKNGAGTSLANHTHTYDSADRVLTETLNATPETYTYDATDQLTNGGTTAYSYDLNGNRTMTGYQTGTGNQLANDGTWTYTYDDEGNLTKKSKGAGAETWTFGFDHRNHLLWAEGRDSDGGTLQMRADYKYDALGNRIEKAVDPDGAGPQGTTVTRFAYDGADVWADLDGSNAVQVRRVYGDGPDQPLAKMVSGAVTFYLPDRLGSVRRAYVPSLSPVTWDSNWNRKSWSPRALTLLARRLRAQVLSFLSRDTAIRRNHARFSAPCSGRARLPSSRERTSNTQ